MSGVAKDDTNPTQPSDETVTAAGIPEAADTEAQATPAPPASESEPRTLRRNPPHLRVVTEGDSDFTPPPAPSAADAPHQRIGAIMRAARENTGFTLDQVSKETRVHLSHLRAIEDMTPNLLGAPVYAKGYIKAYARFLGMDEQTTLERYLSECAILKDPEKQEIAPPATSKSRKLPVAVPMLGILIVALIGAGAFFLLSNGNKQAVAASDDPAVAAAAAADAEAQNAANTTSQRLRIVALRPGMVEVRSAKGDKYVHREFVAGESYPVRVGAQWTVSVNDGAAFEWRLGDQSLGLLKPEGGPVYSQSVDLAAERAPIVAEVPVDPSIAAEAPPPSTGVATPPATGANPAPPKPRPSTPRPQTHNSTPATTPSTQAPAPAQPTTPATDPALAAYPDQ